MANQIKSVDEFLNSLKHPMKIEIEEIRKIILKADKRLTEKIKWNAPSYCIQGDDRITFNLSGQGFIRLIFHCGVKPSDKKLKAPLFEDTSGLLEWAAYDRTIARFNNRSDIVNCKKDLSFLVKKWIEVTT
jgi:hypothetical protein